MKKFLLFYFLGLLFFHHGIVFSMEESGDSRTGNALLDRCTSKFDFLSGYCIGFIDASAIARVSLSDPTKINCQLPKNVNSGQLKDLVVKYLQENPAIRHEEALPIVLKALHKSFPCKNLIK